MEFTAKLRVIEAIRQKVDVFYKINTNEYRIRCPICGDSQSNPRDAHCYIKCSDDPSEPLLYNCFKCNAHGRVSMKFLRKLHIGEDIIKLMENNRFARVNWAKANSSSIVLGEPNIESPQVRYIESRLGPGFTPEDYARFNIVWDMDNIYPYITETRIKHTMPNNNDSITFISEDRSLLLSRSFLSGGKQSQWRKVRIMPGSNKSFYTIKTTSDICGAEEVVVNIAEGIFDILSAYKNFPTEGGAYIATLGSDYISALDFIISKGFIGKNIVIRIYIDNGIDEKRLERALQRYKWLFNSIYLVRNILEKDIGTNSKQISLKSRRV